MRTGTRRSCRRRSSRPRTRRKVRRRSRRSARRTGGGSDGPPMTIDPRTPCIVGVGSHTWRPADTGDAGAPEPLEMWETVVRAAEADSGASLLSKLDAVEIVYCQTWQYDDPVGRLVERLG